MKQWAVSWINFFDNELHTEFVWAPTWRGALMEPDAIRGMFTYEEIQDKELEDVKQMAFDMDAMINVAEVPGVGGSGVI